MSSPTVLEARHIARPLIQSPERKAQVQLDATLSPDEFWSRPGSAVSVSFRQLSCYQPAAVRKVPPARFPREGPREGGGQMQVTNRSIWEHTFVIDDEDPYGGSLTEMKSAAQRATRPNTTGVTAAARGRSINALRPTRSAGPLGEFSTGGSFEYEHRSVSFLQEPSKLGSSQGQNSRDRLDSSFAAAVAKHAQIEALRANDQRKITEKVHRNKDMREQRLKHLLSNVMVQGQNPLLKALSAYSEAEEKKKKRRHDEWEEHIFQPLATKAWNHINPEDREGLKSVAFKVENFRLPVSVTKDPCWAEQVQNAQEKAFEKEAARVLGRAESAPTLQAALRARDPALVPRSLSRPGLDPTMWTEVAYCGTPSGRFSQVIGSHARRLRRGGPGVFIPDETDGVLVAGTRISRSNGHRDMGILRAEGPAAASPAVAPGQDHYTFETGSRVTTIEMPPGKKIVNPMILHPI